MILASARNGEVLLSAFACVLLALAIGASIFYRREFKRFSLFITIISFVIYALIILAINNPVTDDFMRQITWARQYIGGNEEAYYKTYPETWPNMLGYSVVEIPILSLVNSVTVVKLFQALCMSCSLLLVYQCIALYYSKRLAQVATFGLSIFPVFVFTSGTTSNQILSATLCLLAIYLTLISQPDRCKSSKRCVLLLIGAGAALGISNFVRTDALLVLVAIVVAQLLIGSSASNGRDRSIIGLRTRNIIGAAFILGGFLFTTIAIDASLDISGIRSPQTNGEMVTYKKVVMGTNLESSGGHTKDYETNLQALADEEGITLKEACVKTILGNISTPGKIIELEIRKAHRLWWTDPHTFTLIDVNDSLRNLILSFDKAYVMLLLLLCAISLLPKLRKHSRTNPLLLIAVFVLSLTIAAYLIIEVQPRYLYFAYIVMFIIAIDGIDHLLEGMRRKLNRHDCVPLTGACAVKQEAHQ